MLQKIWREVAPSRRAASTSSCGIDANPAARSSEAWPAPVQMTTRATAGSAQVGEERTPVLAPGGPADGPSAGASIQDHTTPRASGEAAQGMMTNARDRRAHV